MTIDEAIDIAWGADQYRGVPRPTVEEALERIEHQLTTCKFNWITGQQARDVLGLAIAESAIGAMRRRLDDLHSKPRNREELEAVYGRVWTKAELQAEFDVLEFIGDSVEVRRKCDGLEGSLSFQESPRLYFCYIEKL